MILKTEEELKKQLSLYGAKPVTLLVGNEPALIGVYSRRILDLLQKDGGEVERFDGRKLDLSALADASLLLPMCGGLRILCVEDFDPTALSERDAADLAALLSDWPIDSAIVLCVGNGIYEPPKKNSTSLDAKKTAAAKKIFDAADQSGIVACLDRRHGAALQNALRSRCKKAGCEMSASAAAHLTERCGDDLGALLNECDKLCALVGQGEITANEIDLICPRTPEDDLYEIARRMLRGDVDKTLSLISDMIAQKTPVALILANLGSTFADLSRACAARSAGKTAEEMAKELHFRFEWRAKNAFRDASRFDPQHIHRACQLLYEAESTLKSMPVDECVLLDTTVIGCMAILKEGAR
jgi:DNA polymerase-3 subunit delta